MEGTLRDFWKDYYNCVEKFVGENILFFGWFTESIINNTRCLYELELAVNGNLQIFEKVETWLG